MTLLLMNALIVQKDLIDDPHKRIQLGTNRWTLARLNATVVPRSAWRHGVLQDLRYRLAAMSRSLLKLSERRNG
jgi:hypothetical protein